MTGFPDFIYVCNSRQQSGRSRAGRSERNGKLKGFTREHQKRVDAAMNTAKEKVVKIMKEKKVTTSIKDAQKIREIMDFCASDFIDVYGDIEE